MEGSSTSKTPTATSSASFSRSGRKTPEFLIDITDARFLISANDDVIAFVRRTNPFAHSDVGSVLLELGKALSGARAYCPSYGSCAYVVLHTERDRIFAIAFDQRGLAFRLAEPSRADAFADGGLPAAEIGPDWVRFAPWAAVGADGPEHSRCLGRWCTRAFDDAVRDSS